MPFTFDIDEIRRRLQAGLRELMRGYAQQIVGQVEGLARESTQEAVAPGRVSARG